MFQITFCTDPAAKHYFPGRESRSLENERLLIQCMGTGDSVAFVEVSSSPIIKPNLVSKEESSTCNLDLENPVSGST